MKVQKHKARTLTKKFTIKIEGGPVQIDRKWVYVIEVWKNEELIDAIRMPYESPTKDECIKQGEPFTRRLAARLKQGFDEDF